jgi:ubiquinone/menaquinone biosynthesis C-methylase UbiE
MDFSHFDKRRYHTLPVQEGYGEWVANYEQTVQDEMDIRLLARIQSVAWAQLGRVIDLACGTGRIGVWLTQQGVQQIDGIDFTPQMLALAAEKGVYAQLFTGNVFDTGLPSETYDLAVQSLADEHLATLKPLYRETARITKANGRFVIVGLHPHYLMNGIPTHFHRSTGEAIAVESYVHLLSDHVKAAHAAGWILIEMDEGVVDEEWLAKKPQWQPMLNQPVSFAMVWRKHT